LYRTIHYYTNYPTPYQLELAKALVDFQNLEIIFYEGIARDRPKYWNLEIPKNCKVLGLSNRHRYLDLRIFKFFFKTKPDVILISSFFLFPSVVLYLMSIIFRTKVYFLTETWRENNKLRSNGFLENLVSLFYQKIHGIIAVNPIAEEQMRLFFPNKKIFLIPYPVSHSHIKFKIKEKGIRLIFANRLVSYYNPIRALKIFSDFINMGYDGVLYLNSNGELLELCKRFVSDNNLTSKCFFLEDIQNWKDLDIVYSNSNIYFFPAIFTNGNLSLYEMMFSGCGIIISENIFDAFLVHDGVNGYKCKSDLDFINSLIKYHDSDEILQNHIKINYNLANSKFNIHILSSMYKNFFLNA